MSYADYSLKNKAEIFPDFERPTQRGCRAPARHSANAFIHSETKPLQCKKNNYELKIKINGQKWQKCRCSVVVALGLINDK